MKFYQKRGFALVVLVLAILGSCVYGISKKPADLPQVSYGNWLRDDADLLTDETEASLRQYDQSWDSDYRAIIAVATLDTLNGWTYEKAAAELGSQWGLGGNDMLLLLVKDSDYYVALGDNVLDAMTDTYQAGLQGAVETPYYQGDYDAAALAFFRQADVFYAQTLGRQHRGHCSIHFSLDFYFQLQETHELFYRLVRWFGCHFHLVFHVDKRFERKFLYGR